MASLCQSFLFGLALAGLLARFQSFRINYKKTGTFKKVEGTFNSWFTCCNINQGLIYDRENGAVPVQDKKCKQHQQVKEKSHRPDRQVCTTGEYSSPGKMEWTLLKTETLEHRECGNAPWCADLAFSKCYKIIEGTLSPWSFPAQYYRTKMSQQHFPLGMELSVSGKLCSANKPPIMTYKHKRGPFKRFAYLTIEAVVMLGSEECEGDKWKQYGLEAAPECDDFDFWKQVLITEGINAPNWQASIAAAKASSPEGMSWGTTLSDEAADDTLWNARRDTVLGKDDILSSWS